MPNNFFSVESRFPNIADKTQEEINGELINYLYMLLEQLRYTLGNLGVGNFNESGLDEIAGMISSPIYAKIEDAEGNIAQLSLTAEGLTSRVESAEGSISTLTQAADGLVSRVESAEGSISTLTQTSAAMTSRIEDAEGNISSLTQTSESLASQIKDADGNISELTQTVGGLSTRVASVEGNVSTLTQTATLLSARVSNTEGDISTLEQTASGLTVRVSNAEGDISTLEQTAEGLTARVGNAEVAISNLGVTVSGAVTVQSLADASINTVINNATVTTTSGVLSSQLGAGALNFFYGNYLYGQIVANANGMLLAASAVMRGDAVQIFWNGTSGVYLQMNSATYMSIDQYGVDFAVVPTIAKTYVLLNTGNMMNYIANNAAEIRATLGL